jgi:hypothetical protein
MTPNDAIAACLERDVQMLQFTLGDFSDADMLARPAPNANHAAWQLGHLIAAEVGAGNAAKPGSMPELPAGFAERFAKDKARSDNPADFPTKAELLAQFERVRRATTAWAKAMTSQDYGAPTPEKIRGWAPTVGQLAIALSGHVAMHIGQFQVIRRKLGKPVLF